MQHASETAAIQQELNRCLQAAETLYQRHMDASESQNFLDKALNLFSQALEMDPAQTHALGRMARISIKQCRFAKAAQLAKKALTVDPGCYDALHVLGYLAFREKNEASCVHAMQKAAVAGGLKSAKSHLCLHHVYANMPCKNTGVKQKIALKVRSLWHGTVAACLFPFEQDRLSFANLVKIVPTVLYGQFKEETRHIDQALQIYLRLYEHFPGLSSVSNGIGTIYHKKKLHSEALYWFEKTTRRHPSNEYALLQMGQILEEKNEPDKATAIYQKLLNISPKDANVHCSLGNAYYSTQQMEDSLSHYNAAFSLGTEPAWRALIAQSIANVYLEHQNNSPAATSALQMAIELEPDDIDTYIQLGLLYFKQKDYQNAKLVYEKAISMKPNNPRLYSNLGYLHWMEGDLEQAETLYKKAIELDPFYEIPYNNLGVIYLDSLGQVPQAIECLEKATTMNENYALAFYNLGRAYSFLDQKLLAAGCFEKAKKLNTFTKELDNEELVARIHYLFESPASAAGDLDTM